MLHITLCIIHYITTNKRNIFLIIYRTHVLFKGNIIGVQIFVHLLRIYSSSSKDFIIFLSLRNFNSLSSGSFLYQTFISDIISFNSTSISSSEESSVILLSVLPNK